MGELAAVVLAAGRGRRLRPLTDILPKPLCPVGNRALLDWALDRLRGIVDPVDVAVNVHHGRAALEAHLAGLPHHVSIEHDEALGTAGAIGNLRDWIACRQVVVLNADAWGPSAASTERLVADWDGAGPRVLVVADDAAADFEGVEGRFAGASLLPADDVAALRPEPSGLYETVWREAHARGRLEFAWCDDPFFDCGTPAEYLAANMAWSGGESVIGGGAVVQGEVIRSVVWPGGVVAPGERLVDAVRVGADLTVTG